MAELIYFVADIVAKVGDVPLVRTEVKEVEDGSRRRLHDHPALAAARGCHLHLHVFGKRRKPAAVACFHDKQVVVELNAAELSPFLFKEHPDCRVRRPCVVGEVECRCLHGDCLVPCFPFVSQIHLWHSALLLSLAVSLEF